MNRRVVITGLGLVTPLGVGTRETWSGLIAGRSGIGTITRFDATDYASRIAGECRDFKSEDWVDKKELRKMDLFIHFGVAAAQMAWKESGIVVTEENAHRIGVTIGSGIGGLTAIQNQAMVLKEKGPRRISPFFIPMSLINLISGHVAILYGLKGPNHAPVTACATGNHAIGDAMAMIRRGDADVMLAGGAEAAICELGVGGFAAAKALSTRNDAPTQASRPWDKDRDGFVIAEGAGVMVLEEMEMAKKRGAVIYAEVVGYGMSGDAHHITAPSPDGSGATTCMQNALRDGQADLDLVHYINAHGTSTPLGDVVETVAMKRVFGEARAKKLMISSTKSMTGHLLGAAGGVEAIFTALALYHKQVPPTINLDNPDPECDLDYVPHTARDADMEYALTNSFGFGGTNSSLLLKRFR
ncbi:MAG: beta-ketoacyl-ACP synthase II [Magnetococcales bacterium]|nr:beta-ketoacyl-ACP synthase II [Magnetococcales bacterium]MBF0148687.1 beta-ketoacyl-ACP synthase II [Magnetococcales bacterium]MBF0173334.1 beta-ketoacyl-ACP synthase II [Magnetococcales bacterium]MBF0631493.1 beta-ketoacyl-ACP synthase II [Magnetococcales bacterium]